MPIMITLRCGTDGSLARPARRATTPVPHAGTIEPAEAGASPAAAGAGCRKATFMQSHRRKVAFQRRPDPGAPRPIFRNAHEQPALYHTIDQ
jgi:hypothetical protein